MRKMTTPRRLTVAALVALAIGACGDKQPTEVIAQPAMQTMERARDVQATVDQQKKDIDAAVEAQGN